MTLTAQPQARSDSTITPSATVTVIGAGPLAGMMQQPVLVFIVRNGSIVGTYAGAIGGTGVGFAADAAPSTGFAIPVAPVLLSGCPAAPIDFAHPDATRRPLPPGDYQLVARLECDGAAPSVISSDPVGITITG